MLATRFLQAGKGVKRFFNEHQYPPEELLSLCQSRQQPQIGMPALICQYSQVHASFDMEGRCPVPVSQAGENNNVQLPSNKALPEA
ncbi:hypothetical protein [Endozoicomonas euniceicola]|uniref:Uncharacterized protein n=1 Tax=Endozoicomonas euniceicola TaxID=1234143 RepID=A0ABY6GVA1_9GAMM|nr:hypothetical protein [Endozoicomonas euniceicola]UYM16605.1 hypothetical protein NX720_01345 [Endozoicomonas euniceicola]